MQKISIIFSALQITLNQFVFGGRYKNKYCSALGKFYFCCHEANRDIVEQKYQRRQ